MERQGDYSMGDEPRQEDRLLFSREAEEAVLGSVLINPEVVIDLLGALKPEDFYIQRNRWVWEAMKRLDERRITLDILTICTELEKSHHLEESGGPAYLTGLLNQVPSSLNAMMYAGIISELSMRRALSEAGRRITQLAFDREKNINSVLAASDQQVTSVLQMVPNDRSRTFAQALSEYYDNLLKASQASVEAEEQGSPRFIPTGITDLDELLSGGMQRSDLVIVAGRPGMGKTSLLLSIVRNAAQSSSTSVGVFSLEMSIDQLVQRFISMETGISAGSQRLAKLSENEWSLVLQAVQDNESLNIWLDDTPSLTPASLRARCLRWKKEHGLDMVVVDYIQLMTSDGRGSDNRVQEVSKISRALKQLAKELNVPVLAAAQLSRDIEKRDDKTPRLSDLRESGSLEQDADIVIFIHRPEPAPAGGEEEGGEEPDVVSEDITELFVAKHRHGPTGSIQAEFEKNKTQFK